MLLLVYASLIIFFPYLIYRAVGISRREKKPEVAVVDCIVVLSGPVSSRGELSRIYWDRIREAYNLYQENIAPRVLLSGGHGPGAAKFAYYELLHMGIPKKDLIVEMKSKFTEHHPSKVRQICEEHGFRKSLILTSFFHVYRARTLFRRENINSIVFYPIEHPWLKTLYLWKLRELVLFLYNDRFRLIPLWVLAIVLVFVFIKLI